MNAVCSKAVRIGDKEVSVSGDKEFVEAEFDKLIEKVFGTSDLAVAVEIPVKQKRGKGLSLREFLEKRGSVPQRGNMVLVGYYMEKELGQQTFTREELEALARENKVPLGKNPWRDVAALIQGGLIEPLGERAGRPAYRLTLKGEKFAEEKEGA